MTRFLLILLFVCNSVWADGVQGLTYYTYQGTSGPSPSINPLVYPTVRSTGISASINYPTGSFNGVNILGSGFGDRVIVKWVGYINIPTTGTYYFGANADDGFKILIDDILVTDSWIDSGGAFRSGAATTLSAGAHALTFWYYENGGGQMVIFQYSTNNTNWTVVPTTMLATDSTYWGPVAPALCCGGSSAGFTVDPTHVNRLNTFNNRGTADSRVYIDQIGNDNTITVDQSGTRNNSVTYTGNGSFNNVDITQSSTSPTATNYTEVTVNGNSNTIDLTQTSTDGTKSAFVTVSDNNNTVIINQKDSGNHYLNLNLSGGNKSADILQQGAGAHQADITLSGAGARSINLIQQGTTAQSYSINSSCAGSCEPISVTQGQ